MPRPNLFVCSRHAVRWGGFEMVRATLDLLRLALARERYAWLHLISGQCLPLWPQASILARFDAGPPILPVQQAQRMDCTPFPVPGLPYQGFDRILVDYPPDLRGRFRGVKAKQLEDYKESVLRDPSRHRKLDHLPRLYHGSQWFSITGAFAAYILEYVDRHPEFPAFFESSLIPDEMFFQTILMDSPFASARAPDNARYTDWTQGGPHTLRTADVPAVLGSGKLFARKFDLDVDEAAAARIGLIVALRAARPETSAPALLEAVRDVRTLADADLEDSQFDSGVQGYAGKRQGVADDRNQGLRDR
jgi:hypothetical protein